MWLLGVARVARLWRQCTSEGGKPSTRESADPFEVLYGSCNGESSGISLLSVACIYESRVTRPEDFGRIIISIIIMNNNYEK